MPHKPGFRSSRPSRTSAQIFSARLPVALRALASRKGLPCCVRRSRTDVTATINQTSSENGSSGMGMLPFICQPAIKSDLRKDFLFDFRCDPVHLGISFSVASCDFVDRSVGLEK